MTGGGPRLGIDFGTSSTVAVLQLPDREPRPLLFDGSPLLPSAVGVDTTGHLVVGRDALHAATTSPGAVERYPKRCIDDGATLLGDLEVPVADMFGVVLSRVVDEATRVTGTAPVEITVTHPAAWGEERRARLRAAAAASAGTAQVRLIAEPVAAARHLVGVAGDRLPDGGTALVYDLGAGTFDATVVRRTGDTFAILATQGRPDSGGLDIDAAIVTHLAAAVPDEAVWRRLTSPETVTDRRARQQLWDNVRAAKEALTRASATLVHLPLLDIDAPLGREELDELARPILEQTIRTSRAVLTEAAAEPGTVFLVGAASRMPAVSSALHRALGVEPVTVDQPELAVAEGSLLAADATAGLSSLVRQPGRVGPAVAVASDPTDRSAAVPTPTPSTRPRGLLIIAGATVLAVTVGVAAYAGLGDDPGSGRNNAAATHVAASSPSPSPSPSKTYPPGVDPCLLGTWRVSNATGIWSINGRDRQTQGQAGELQTFGEDNVLLIDENHAAPTVADAVGVRWEARPSGTGTMRYSANLATRELQLAVLKTDAKHKVYTAGKFHSETNVVWPTGLVKYTCGATSLIQSGTLDEWSSESTRVT